MADEIKLKAPTVEQQVVVNINGEEKLRSFADTLEKISNNKNLQKYWKTQQELINATADAYGNFSKKASQDNAKELIKVTNALKAMSGTDLSNILPDFDKISKAMAEAQKVAGNIDSAFSIKGFKEAFDSFETLKAYGVDIQNLFSHFGVSSDVGELQKNVRALEGEVEKLTRRLANAKNANEELRNEFDNFKSGSGFADKLDELDNLKSEMSYLREQAEETFRQFLKLNNITEDGYDRDGFYDDNRFKEYFQNIQSGYLSASDAIQQFKREYSYLLDDSFKSNNDTFGLEQLQAFSNKLDSIFRQVEETSTKINDIISNGVITKSVENLSMDSSLSDSQRSLFGNLLQDEESLKSITALFQKLIEESNKTSKVDLFNDEQLQQVLSIFDKMEGHLSSLRSIISDIGDGEEFSPLLKMINNVQSSISELTISVKGIGLNMNIDVGSDSEMEAKVQSKIANALQAYQRLFDHIKMSSAGGSIINTNFFEFDINQYDTMMGKLQAYKKFIDNMRKEAKARFNGQDVLYQDTEKSYWTQASAAMGQVTRAFNEMNAASDTNPLKDLFGSGDLSEVISQLGLIVAKLEEISTTASSFKNVFDNGFNVTASVEEIDKLTNRVKELEDELSKIKLNPVNVDKSNISSENFTNQIVENENKKQEAYKATADTVMYHAGVISKLNKAETNGRFYGSDRGSGYFGTGHYFVDSVTKHELDNSSSYSKLPYTSIDISQYDNLFKATTNEIADGLHAFLKNLTKFTQGRDTYSVSELFSQFQKVFGETVMDMQEFDAKLENLKTYMQNSNMDDRGDSVSTQFMKSLGYGGVDTRGTKYADTRYGTVIYDLKEESILQANITDELQKQGQMLEKINYEKGQVFDKSEDTRIQSILDQQAKSKEIDAEFNKLYDSTQLKAYESELDSVNNKLKENDNIISECSFAIANADEDAKQFAKEMKALGIEMSQEEIDNTVNQNRESYQTRIDELEKERPLLEARKQELEQNLQTEYELANATRERAKAIVEERNKPIEDVFQGDKINQATTSAKELDKTLEQVDIPTDSFDEVLSKLDLAKSELGEIVKITKQSVSDSEGKFHDSYTLKDKRGSTEIYGLSSNTEKGQLLRSNIVGYDAKEIEKEAKAIQKLAEEKRKLRQQEKQSTQSSVDKALKDQVSAWKQIQSIREKIAKSNDANEIENLKKVKKEYQQSYIEADKILKTNSDLYDKEAQIARLEQVRLETNKKIADYKNPDISSMESSLARFEESSKKLSLKPDNEHSFESWKLKIDELNNAINEYRNKITELQNKDGIIDKEDISEATELENRIKSLLREMQKTSSGDKGFEDISATKIAEQIHKLLEDNTAMSRKAKAEIQSYYDEVASGNPSRPLKEIYNDALKVVQAERAMGREGKSFLDTMKDKAWYGWAAQITSMFGVYDIINIFKQGANTLKEFDDGLTKISYTMDMTKSQLDNLGKSVLDMASDMKSSIDDAMQVAQIYANMQTSAEEIKKLSEPTLILSNLTGFDASTVADDIQAVTQQFDIAAESSMHIADVYDQISRNISVDYSKGIESIAEAVQVAGSTANQAGLSFEQLAAIVGKTVEKTRLEGSQVGNGLKTIMTRLSKVGELSEEVDNETLSQASESLKKVGIEVYNLDGSYREFDVIMGELAGKWDDLTDAEKSNISFNIAATRQTNLLSAVLSNFSDSMQLAEEATNANGSALENQQKYMESFSGHLQSLETEAKIAWLNILDSETLKDGVDLLTGLVKVVGQLVDTFGLLGTAAGIGGIVAGFKNVGINTLVAY